MKQLNQYIAKTVLFSILFVLLTLCGIQFFILLVHEIKDIGIGHYTLIPVLSYVFLIFSTHLYHLFPMICFLGGLLGLGHLASHLELTVMRVSGMSALHIVRIVILTVLPILLIITLLGETLAPYASHSAEIQKAVAKSGGQTLNTTQGIWMRDKNTFIHIEKMVPGRFLSNITQYQVNPQFHLSAISHAQKAIFKNQKWWLEEINTTTLGKTITTQYVKTQPWSVKVDSELLNVSHAKPEEMSLIKLTELIQYQRHNGLPTAYYVLAFWQRIFQPLASLVMIILSIPLILGPLRSMTMGLRLTLGMIIGFGFYLANQFIGSLSLVYHFPPLLGALLPSILFLILGVLFVNR